MAEIRNKKVPLTAYTIPETRVANRTEIFNDDDAMDTTVETSDSQRMDALMQKLMGTHSDTESESAEEEEEEKEKEENEMKDEQKMNNELPVEEKEAFVFRLFASKPVAKVNITEKDDDHTNRLAELAAKQQKLDFDQENDPEFIALVQASVVNYDDILVQSKQPYYSERNSNRIIHIPSLEQQEKEKEAADKKKQRRKSKKRRDFEKAVREGRIQVKPKMRNPAVEGGWPGWPGHLTKCHIITTISSDDIKKSGKKNGPLPPLPSFSSRGRGGFGNRGNRGGARGRGRGRGGSS
ncbi:hypothetical protein INT45_001599 [Circinella minor]|uniref:Uncharacterized protein n=1 Tax=Circinella minor TaxID=1195481 RepID=A0A8H7RS49_9FUNG|nr:hypothetical protein INT45_001599 [Circinella minor]